MISVSLLSTYPRPRAVVSTVLALAMLSPISLWAQKAHPQEKQTTLADIQHQTEQRQSDQNKINQDKADQNKPDSRPKSTYTLTTNVNEVDLVFTVTDSHGNFVKNLKESDFALLDNQRAPAAVYSFTQETQLPLRLGILIDTSSSIRNRFQFEQQAVTSFLLQIMRPSTDEAFVEGFAETPDVVQGWTNNIGSLTTAIQQLYPGGGTALYDAVYSACRDKLLNAASGPMYVRRAIVLVSDGDDDQSHAYLSDAIKECQRAQTAIYAISTDMDPSPDPGDKILRKMAEETGGRAYFPRQLQNLPASFSSLADELRSQYALVYKPADFKANGQFRSIYLYCLDQRYKVHTMKGYFTPKAE